MWFFILPATKVCYKVLTKVWKLLILVCTCIAKSFHTFFSTLHVHDIVVSIVLCYDFQDNVTIKLLTFIAIYFKNYVFVHNLYNDTTFRQVITLGFPNKFMHWLNSLTVRHENDEYTAVKFEIRAYIVVCFRL